MSGTGRAHDVGRRGLYCVGQVLLIAGLFMVYRLGRQLAVGHPEAAMRHAAAVWELQRLLGMPSEVAVQRLAMHSIEFVRLANGFYLGVHFSAVLVFLGWVLLRHHDHWTRVRNVLVLATAAAFVIHIGFPLAPPRFLPQVLPGVHLVDTGALIGPSPYASEAARDTSNQYAAMPSLHVGWAILEAWGAVTILRARARWLALAHPVVTLFVVVLTANHFWLDGLVGGALVVGAVWLTAPARSARPAGLARRGLVAVRNALDVLPGPVGRPSTGKTPVGHGPVGQIPMSQSAVGQSAVGQSPVGQSPVGQASVQKCASGARPDCSAPVAAGRGAGRRLAGPRCQSSRVALATGVRTGGRSAVADQ